MNKLFNRYVRGQAKTNKLFKDYSKFFRVLLVLSGPVITLQIVLFFLPESLIFDVLCTSYLILTFVTFLVETVIHSLKYLKNNK